ncbi:hypothetical protein EAS64_33845 [Trebonia kvetii]|uniref:Phage-like element PBSX protein XkdF domain-containing protein n=1 Tax=Trebonia kvetii TaxID=2480626 RepID=A0A6P2BQH5_9ACTN|nr:XkdF-like putative serine protease domain-containing protein [Trebonia kvetii]TVZ01264.1 hypothetical protein EAS64_33845 [Trebonia kvetii]
MFSFTLPDGSVYVGDESAAKSYWDGETVKGVVIKSNDELRYTLCVAYPVDTPDVEKARDGFRDFASEEALRKAAWSFMDNGAEVGAFHAEGTEGAGRTVESYILPCDWVVKAVDGEEYTIPAGSWMQGTIWSEPAWDLIKSGEITGMSMQGGAKRRTPSPADVARILANR